MTPLPTLKARIEAALGHRVVCLTEALGELTLVVAPQHYLESAQLLHVTEGLQFEQLVDLCGIDYSTHDQDAWREGRRFAVVSHLLSVACNHRLRLRVFCDNDDAPKVDSLTPVWSGADWFEREAFDMYGVLFDGHPDLRRILTDYGFIGHPLRKDFPLIGHVEMTYDEKLGRVVYQPVTIEQREITPRVVREEHYGGLN